MRTAPSHKLGTKTGVFMRSILVIRLELNAENSKLASETVVWRQSGCVESTGSMEIEIEMTEMIDNEL